MKSLNPISRPVFAARNDAAAHSVRYFPKLDGLAMLGNATLRSVAISVLTRRAGSGADAAAVATAARRGYDDLAGVLVPLIGQVGVDALTARAMHLAQPEYSWGQTGDAEQSGGPFAQLSLWLERQDPALATDAAVAMLSTLGELLITFIGESLTMRLMRQAWPDGFSDLRVKETAT